MDPTSPSSSRPLPPKPHGFAALAKRISVWTTNSLLTLLVLVAGLGFGRQVLKWWAADASPPGNSIIGSFGDDLGDPAQLHTIQFGDASWSLSRQSIAGDKESMIERLRATCRDVLNTKPRPAVAPESLRSTDTRPRAAEGATAGRGFVGEPPASEQKFLTFLSDAKPADESPGEWRVYEFHEAFPMAVGVAKAAPESGSAPHAPREEPNVTRSVTSTPDVTRSVTSTKAEAGSNLAQAGYRVVVWAVALPTAPGEWTLCRFEPNTSPAKAGSGLVDVALPPGVRRGLTLRAGGAGIAAFHGPIHPEEWKRFFDDWFRSRGWQAATGWQATGAAWCAKFAAADGGGAVDVRFGPDDRGGSSGLLMMTSPGAK